MFSLIFTFYGNSYDLKKLQFLVVVLVFYSVGDTLRPMYKFPWDLKEDHIVLSVKVCDDNLII